MYVRISYGVLKVDRFFLDLWIRMFEVEYFYKFLLKNLMRSKSWKIDYIYRRFYVKNFVNFFIFWFYWKNGFMKIKLEENILFRCFKDGIFF